jgi:two-component system nitrate/nitrite response regulator NarL
MKVVIADDHQLVLNGIRSALNGAEDIEVIGEARRGSQVLPLVNQLRPDAVLLDIRMPEMDGIACLELIRKRFPEIRVVMLSVHNDAERIESALRRGASGYIVKSISPADLGAALRNAVEGTVFHAFGSPPGEGPASETAGMGLTERELSILRAVARGLSNRAIATELWVT